MIVFGLAVGRERPADGAITGPHSPDFRRLDSCFITARRAGEMEGPTNGPIRECLRLLGPQPPYLVEQLARSRRVGMEEDESFGIDQGAVPLAPLQVEDRDGLEDAGIVRA